MTMPGEKPRLTLLVRDPEARANVPSGPALRIISKPDLTVAAHRPNLFVLATASCLEDVAQFVTTANKRNQLRALFVRFDSDPSWLPRMFELANLRTMRNTIVHSDFKVPNRILFAWQAGAQGELIADARVFGEDLIIVSCEPNTYAIPFASISALDEIPVQERGDFRLADDGSYLHWPGQDIHLDLDSLLIEIQPERRARAEKVKRAHGKVYGEAIARLRSESGLRQGDIAGLSEREVRRIESSGQVTVDSLRKLAAAHRLKLSEYLDRLAEITHVSSIKKAADQTATYKITKRK